MSGLLTTNVLNTNIREVENKILDASSLVTTTVLNTKIGEVENKFIDYAKYITSLECNKLTVENFAASIKEADLVTITDCDNKLTIYNKQIASNKIKHLAVQKKLNGLIINNYKFFLSRKYFAGNNGSQNTFVYQPTLDTLE